MRNHSCISKALTINFLESSRKKWRDFTLKKRRLSEYVTKVIKNMFSNAIFKTLIEKWLIYHKEKEFNDFWLKKGFLKSQKLKFLKKK